MGVVESRGTSRFYRVCFVTGGIPEYLVERIMPSILHIQGCKIDSLIFRKHI
jgi:hypothetical protein